VARKTVGSVRAAAGRATCASSSNRVIVIGLSGKH
jgi:hypothetical protein